MLKVLYKKINEIDGLHVYSVPLIDITEEGHGYAGQPLYSKGEEIYYKKLRDDISQYGITIVPPIVLYPENESIRWHICDGWHRWMIAIELGLEAIPAVIFHRTEEMHPTPHIRW